MRASEIYKALSLSLAFSAAASHFPAVAGDELGIPGPILATVERVIDGDTVAVRATIWPGHMVASSIRLAGIDTPEKGRGARCPAEAALATQATAYVAEALPPGSIVQLFDVRPDKYFGRVVARLLAQDGQDIAQALLAANLAYPYHGGRKSALWCR